MFLLLIGISKAVVLLGLRLQSRPLASARVRSRPLASARLRSPPVTSGRPRSPSTFLMGLWLVRVVPGWASVGRGALFQRTNAFWGLNNAKPGGVTSARVEVCAKSVPTLVEPCTFEQCVLKEEHSNQTSGHGAGI